ncbi:MAG: putative 2OG-Fe(II) oxygenase [Minwuia sp.]|nr:putative 2OG-Fe(II) oxygenase [Minwuia sp.]
MSDDAQNPEPETRMIGAFASPIMVRRAQGSDALNARLAQTVRNMAHSGPSDDDYRAHQGGFYSDVTFFQDAPDGAAELQPIVARAVTDYITRVLGGSLRQGRVEISAWVGLHRERDYQTPHVHAGTTISGIYYVQVPPGKPEPQGCLDILNPLDLQEMTFLRGFAKTHCRVHPLAGDIVVFPAYCKHLVHPFFGDGERITVVFNATVVQPRLGKTMQE